MQRLPFAVFRIEIRPFQQNVVVTFEPAFPCIVESLTPHIILNQTL